MDATQTTHFFAIIENASSIQIRKVTKSGAPFKRCLHMWSDYLSTPREKALAEFISWMDSDGYMYSHSLVLTDQDGQVIPTEAAASWLKTSEETTEETSEETPEETSEETPEETSEETPEETSEETPEPEAQRTFICVGQSTDGELVKAYGSTLEEAEENLAIACPDSVQVWSEKEAQQRLDKGPAAWVCWMDLNTGERISGAGDTMDDAEQEAYLALDRSFPGREDDVEELWHEDVQQEWNPEPSVDYGDEVPATALRKGDLVAVARGTNLIGEFTVSSVDRIGNVWTDDDGRLLRRAGDDSELYLVSRHQEQPSELQNEPEPTPDPEPQTEPEPEWNADEVKNGHAIGRTLVKARLAQHHAHELNSDAVQWINSAHDTSKPDSQSFAKGVSETFIDACRILDGEEPIFGDELLNRMVRNFIPPIASEPEPENVPEPIHDPEPAPEPEPTPEQEPEQANEPETEPLEIQEVQENVVELSGTTSDDWSEEQRRSRAAELGLPLENETGNNISVSRLLSDGSVETRGYAWEGATRKWWKKLAQSGIDGRWYVIGMPLSKLFPKFSQEEVAARDALLLGAPVDEPLERGRSRKAPRTSTTVPVVAPKAETEPKPIRNPEPTQRAQGVQAQEVVSGISSAIASSLLSEVQEDLALVAVTVMKRILAEGVRAVLGDEVLAEHILYG